MSLQRRLRKPCNRSISAEAKVATALNGEFVPARVREAIRLKDGDRIPKLSRRGRVGEMTRAWTVIPIPDFTLYGARSARGSMLGTSQYPSPAILAEARARPAPRSSPFRSAASQRGSRRGRISGG